jgi:hypothetical protein
MPKGALSVAYVRWTARPYGESTQPDVEMGLTSLDTSAGYG